jgi:DNA end-binding protein Ku
MRTVWRGAISLGLVTIPVRAYAATEDHDLHFHHVHRADGGRIRHRRECEACGAVVDFADISRGYELDDGRLVMLDKDDFDALPRATGHTMRVVHFVPAGEVPPIYFQRSYYLEPEDTAVHAYVLLRQALERTQRTAIVKIAMRRREILGAVHSEGDMLMLHTMLWPDQIRPPEFSFLDREVTVRPAELAAATSLVSSMTSPFDPGDFTDEYRAALEQLIETRAEDAQPPPIPPQRVGDQTMDLLEALQLSVERARAED